jgi:2,4-dienoyl-CoA reductase-like NADH-dependent reductase (Old Yellow Enzyme family)
VAGPFSPVAIGPLRLRNRIVKPATFEGMCPGGLPSEALLEHHRAVAAGGAAMTTVAYASVSPEGRSYATQLLVRPEALPALRRLTDAVHREGAAVSLQIGHCGDFADPRVTGARPLGPSRRLDLYHRAVARPMVDRDIERVVDDFARTAGLAREAGFDAVEPHFGHGYLVSQFLSPWTNRRRDGWGGSLENRMRLAVAVLRASRAAVGPEFPVVPKVNLSDGFAGGLGVEEAVEVARRLEQEGATALALSGGFVSRAPLYMLRGDVPVEAMARAQPGAWARMGLRLFGRLAVPAYPFEEGFFLPEARRVRAAVRLPLLLLGGLRSRIGLERAVAEGFDLLGMGRALLHDPELPMRLERGEVAASGCVPCNECIAEMDRGGVRCSRAGGAPGPDAPAPTTRKWGVRAEARPR